jgi:hypothetical protein
MTMLRRILCDGMYVTDHHPKCGCGNFAEFFVEVHSVDFCHEEPTLTQLMCLSCFKLALFSANRICELGGETCVMCGYRIVTPGDFFVRIIPVG